MNRFVPVAVVAVLVLGGCAGTTSTNPPIEVFPDMDRQPRYDVQAASPFFADGRASRQPVPGTVAQGQLRADESWETGAIDGMYVGQNPLELNVETLERGQERFNIYCAPCHDRTGQGRGIVGQRSLWLATNLTDQRIRDMVDGELYHVATYGRRTMPGYRFQVPASDRWAIVAYVRALERTSGTIEDVPADVRGDLR